MRTRGCELDRVRIDTRKVEVDEELITAAVRIHWEASRTAASAAEHDLLGNSVEVTKRIEVQDRGEL
jgi:hypothetical protein